MNHGATNGIILAVAWLALMIVSGLIFSESEPGPSAQQTPLIMPPHTERQQLRIDPYQKAEDAEEENSEGGWRRRRTAFA